VAGENAEVVSDQAARTIASWWHSPAPTCRAITALSHGRPFDTDELLAEMPREVEGLADADALMIWAVYLAELLADA
jgi:hypothetical protein